MEERLYDLRFTINSPMVEDAPGQLAGYYRRLQAVAELLHLEADVKVDNYVFGVEAPSLIPEPGHSRLRLLALHLPFPRALACLTMAANFAMLEGLLLADVHLFPSE